MSFDYRENDDYGLSLEKERLDVTRTSLHFKFRDEKRNIYEFTLPAQIGRGLFSVVKRFYKRESYSYIDIPITLQTEEGNYRRIFRGIIDGGSREIIYSRLAS